MQKDNLFRLFRIAASGIIVAGILVVILLIVLCLSIIRTESVPLEAALPQNGQLVSTQYGKVFIREAGPPTGRPILFTHGVGGSGGLWYENTSLLAKRGYRTIAIDLPPFGFSERSTHASYSRREQAEQILAIIKQLDLHNVIMVGHSFGSGASVEAAMLSSKDIAQLVLVDSALGIQTTSNHAPSPFLAFSFSIPGIRNLVTASTFTNPLLTRYLLSRMLYQQAAVNDSNIHILQQPLVVEDSTRSLAVWMQKFITNNETFLSTNPKSYSDLSMPVVIIWGEKDIVTPLHDAYYLQTITHDAKLFVIKDVGHIPYIEDSSALDTVFKQSLLSPNSN